MALAGVPGTQSVQHETLDEFRYLLIDYLLMDLDKRDSLSIADLH